MTETKPKLNTESKAPRGRGAGSRGRGQGGRATFAERPKPEFDQKMLDIRRVTRVVAGGRRMSFAVTMVIGDRKGSVGVGTGKSIDTALAIAKALKNARKHMIKIKTTKDMSIPHEVSAKYTSSHVALMPNRGKGLVAGSAARTILTLAGLTNVTAKFHSGTKNKLNNARAVMQALSHVATPRFQSVMETMQNERDARITS
jgi:small subunit ribosomal protein S5